MSGWRSTPPWPRGRRGRRRPGPSAGACCGAPPTSPAAASTRSPATLTREEGKILKEARGEVLKGISLLEYYAGEGFRMHGKTLPSESRDTFTYTVRQPLGVVGLIAPWNFPWAIPVWKSAPAIVSGNCVVFKPAELTPATSVLLAEIYDEAGLPPGVFNMLVGIGSEVGEAMVNRRELRAISFTGSNKVGNALYVKAAQRGAKVTCEMGGKNAVIVMPDADLDKAAVAIHGGAFGSSGQRCTATSRVIAHPDIKSALVDRLVAAAEKIKLGPGLDDATDMGPSVDDRQWQTVMDYIKVGKGEGARMLTGGTRPEALRQGFFIEPTIFDGVSPAMRIFQEEIFGPVLVGRDRVVARRSAAVREQRRVRLDDVDLHVGHYVGDALCRRSGDGHGARQRADGRRGSAAAVRRDQVDRRRRARNGGRGPQLLHRAEDRVHQLLRQGRAIDDALGFEVWG